MAKGKSKKKAKMKEKNKDTGVVSVKSDLAFRAVFGQENDACKRALSALLEAILNVKIEGLIYANPINLQEYVGSKKSEMDIEITTSTGERIDIEIQRNNMEGFKERIIYYLMRLLSETISHGKDWTKLKKVKVISILEFNLLKETQRFMSCFRFIETEENYELSDVVEAIFLELPKLPENNKGDMCELEKWLFFLDHIGDEQEDEGTKIMLAEIIAESEGIKMAYDTLVKVSADEHMRAKIRMQEKAERDYYTRINSAQRIGMEKGMAKGMAKGMEKGMAKGMKKGIKAMIFGMLNINIPKATILSNLQEQYELSELEALGWYEKLVK